MKIVFLARYLPAEGSTTHMYTLADEMIKKGHEVTIISSGPDMSKSSNDLFENSKQIGINHVIVGFPKKNNKGFFGKISMLIKYLIALPKVRRYIKKNKIDIIHSHYPVTTYIPASLRFFNKKYKFITTHHIIGIPQHSLNRKADKVIAISDELELELIDKYKYRKKSISKIYNGVSTNFYVNEYNKKDYKVKLDLKKDLFTIGFVGKYSYRKGIDILLKSLEKLGGNFQAVFVGEGDFLEQELLKYNFKDKIIIRNFSDPSDYYRAFDCLVLPSREEGFPLVPLEAMLSKTTVIRSNIEGATQQIIDYETGLLFESENHKQLTEKINYLRENPEQNREMSAKAQQYAKDNFTSKSMAIKTLDAYKDVQIKWGKFDLK